MALSCLIFSLGLVWETSDTEYPKQALNLQSETLSSIPSLSEGVMTASGSAQHPTYTCPSMWMA